MEAAGQQPAELRPADDRYRPTDLKNDDPPLHNDDLPALERCYRKRISSNNGAINGVSAVPNGFNIRENNHDDTAPVTDCEDVLKNLSLSRDWLERKSRDAPGTTDDMNGYYQANVHMLGYVNSDGRHEGGGALGNGTSNHSDRSDTGNHGNYGDQSEAGDVNMHLINSHHSANCSTHHNDNNTLLDDLSMRFTCNLSAPRDSWPPRSESESERASSPKFEHCLDDSIQHDFFEGFHTRNPCNVAYNVRPPDPDPNDDQGDFIETDIPGPNPYDFLNSASGSEFSDEENQSERKDAVYEFFNLNHDRHKKETMDKVFQSFERTRNDNSASEAARPVFQMDIPAPHPESISLWSPDVEYPELNSTDCGATSRPRETMNIGVCMYGGEQDDDLTSDLEDETFSIPNIPNNLNDVSSDPSSEHDDELLNVSRQTSTSNFDNDENSFQGDECEMLVYSLEQDIARPVDFVAEEEEFPADETGQVFSHCKRRASADGTNRGRYSRLLDYDPSTSDEDASDPGMDARVYRDLEVAVPPRDATSPRPVLGAERDDDALQGEPERYNQCPLRRPAPKSSALPKVMVWSEYEAYISQVKQIGRSACGPTAVINVLKAFDVFCDKERIKNVITTSLRADKAPLPEYLVSRSVAGTTAERLVEGIGQLTDGAIYGRFFSFYPKRRVDLTRWLANWISKGAVPMVTLNLQRAVPPGWVTPDAWHHQMVYGVGPKGVYLTNPLEILPVSIIEQQLCSESVLLVRRSDVLARWNDQCHLSSLINQYNTDTRWTEFNVLGQVVSVLREAAVPGFQGYKLPWTSHIRIPCMYTPGVSLYVKADSDAFKLLSTADELPLEDSTLSSTSVATSSSETGNVSSLT